VTDHRSVLRYIADCTALELRHLLVSDEDYPGRMNKWTGRYARASAAARSDDIGFLAGRLWLLQLATGDEELRQRAIWLVDRLAGVLSKGATLVDANWDLYFALALGAEITGNRAWAQAALEAARHIMSKRWSAEAGAMLFEAGEEHIVPFEGTASLAAVAWASGADAELRERYCAHLDRVLELGFVRADGSSHQIGQFDSAHKFKGLTTYQGYSPQSTWARGQAWGMTGFTAAYEVTGQPHYLETAARMTDWWLARTADDPVPFYDFDDPDRDQAPRDSCAAAIAANVFLRLNRLRPDPRYLAAADATIAELNNNYLGRGGALLHGSCGRFLPMMFGTVRTREPPKTPAEWPLARRFPQEEVMLYGEYFFVEALYRRTHDDWSMFALPSPILGRA
jgi:unsaturated chondroitin disaccharide hydrolase